MKLYRRFAFIALILIFTGSCEEPLEENIYSQLSPSTLFSSEQGVNKVLNSAYANAHHNFVGETWSTLFVGATPTEEIWGEFGSIAARWVALRDFSWDANHSQIVAMWTTYFYAIRDANIILDNIESEDLSSGFISQSTAEAKFIRGYSYAQLYNLFGAVPLYTSSSDDPLQPRATEEAVRSLIVSDLQDAIDGLPTQDNTPFGKATVGAAQAALMTFYMNTKQWQLAADMAEDIMDSGDYDLQESYENLFALDNEGNSEMIFASTKIAAGPASNINALIFPNLSGKYPFPYSNNSAYAARTYVFDAFVDSFDENDTRKDLIITEWTNTDGVPQEAYGFDKSFPAKYPFDPNAIGASDGNDWPIYRYADVLLSRAEALNELNGPTQEAIDLINDVRERADAPELSLGGFSKESLRDAIIQERKWEFWLEGKSRELELRHDIFISNAVARGKNAQPHHVLYPIPQIELDANPGLVQNPGY